MPLSQLPGVALVDRVWAWQRVRERSGRRLVDLPQVFAPVQGRPLAIGPGRLDASEAGRYNRARKNAKLTS